MRTLVICLFLVAGHAVLADMADDDRTLSPYFHVEGDGGGVESLPLESTEVEIDVVGVIAEVTVRQRYRNDGIVPIHARYVFPASTRAAVHGMRMTIGREVIEAVIRERESAREVFETAKKAGQSASLLEQQRANVFTIRVSNVMPGDRIDVELRYSELLDPTDGVYELVYPTVVGPRYAAHAAGDDHDAWIASPYRRAGEPATASFRLTARLETGVPLQEVSSPSHVVIADWNGLSRATIRLAPEERRAADRDFILRYRLAGETITEGLLLHRGESENFFLLMVQPPARVTDADTPTREYVFVVDVSGSMSGYPLETAKRLLRELAGTLRPVDRFNVILFSGSHILMAPRSIPATEENVATALQVIERRRGGGGTELLSALRQAMSLPHDAGTARSIVLVTDGYIASEREVFGYIRERLGDAGVFPFGIGTSVNRLLIEGVARAGMGEPYVVTDPTEAPEAVARFRDALRFPLLTDIRVEFDGFRAYDVEPASLPDLLAERPLVVQGKWSGENTGSIRIRGVTGAGAYSRAVDLSEATDVSGQRALAFLWARTRLATLENLSPELGSEALRAAITEIGLAYDLLTRHTSFVAVLREVRNPDGVADDVDQPSPLPRGVSNGAVGVGSEPGAATVLLGSVFLGFVAWTLYRRIVRA